MNNNEDINIDELNQNAPNIYNPVQFQTQKLINYVPLLFWILIFLNLFEIKLIYV